MSNYVYCINDVSGIKKNDVGQIIKKISKDKYLVKFIRINDEINIDKTDIKVFKINEVGDAFDFKVCDRCFKRLPTNEFSNNRIKKGGIITKRPSCKDCRKIKDGKSISKKDRDIWNNKKPKEYELFVCPICERTSIAGISKIVLDHNHKSGKVRGFVCESCNTGIGRFDDDPKIVEKAKNWLE